MWLTLALLGIVEGDDTMYLFAVFVLFLIAAVVAVSKLFHHIDDLLAMSTKQEQRLDHLDKLARCPHRFTLERKCIDCGCDMYQPPRAASAVRK